MNDGYIKIYGKIFENPIVNKTPEHLVIWLYLLTNANYVEKKIEFDGELITLKVGQLITGRKKIAKETGVNESKIQRVLDYFQKNGKIEQQMNNRSRLITILKWQSYQKSEQQMNSKRTSNEHQMNTNKEYKEYKKDNKVKNNIEKENINKEKEINEIVDYLNQRIGTKYKPTTKETKQFISGRLEEGYSVEDFKIVIDKKATEWMNTDMEKFLCPSTLFRPSNFEKYLNQKFSKKKDNFDIARELLEKCRGE